MKKLFSIVLCLVCLFSFLSVGAAETAQDEFLSELSGRTYVELFPEFAKDEYRYVLRFRNCRRRRRGRERGCISAERLHGLAVRRGSHRSL